jgi:DNA-directed RNA polymerase specialized sigma24 family protein
VRNLENLGGFRGEASVFTWVLCIAAYTALKVVRKRKGADLMSLDAAIDIPTKDGSG